jgi:hypothetical protein
MTSVGAAVSAGPHAASNIAAMNSSDANFKSDFIYFLLAFRLISYYTISGQKDRFQTLEGITSFAIVFAMIVHDDGG